MMKLISFIIVFITVSLIYSRIEASSWISPPTYEQLLLEGKDDQLGMGRLFIPAMTVPEWEPSIRIYNIAEMSVIEDYRPGSSIFLKPGNYSLLFGSSSDPLDLIQKHFTVNLHQTTIIEPDWSALIVSVIDENMTYIRYGYEILHFDTGISAGIKYSRDESVFDDAHTTWILPPGKYKIVRQGEPFNTIINFSTFELKPGEVNEMTIVINEMLQFIGAGEIGILENLGRRRRDWKNRLNIKGSFTIYSHNRDGEDRASTDIISQLNIDNQVIYDSKPYYLSLRQRLREEWTKTGSDTGFRVSLDELKFINTGIYYFTNVFGVFGEVNLSTKIFSTSYYDISGTITRRDRSGETSVITDRDIFRTSEPFTPFELEERAGLNFTVLKTTRSNLYLRTGIGFVQTFNKGVYSLTSSSATNTTFTELDDRFEKGLIFSAGGDFQITKNITYTSNANLFYSLDAEKEYNLKWENDIMFKLFRYMSIDYNFTMTYDYNNYSDNYLVYDNRIALELSYFLHR